LKLSIFNKIYEEAFKGKPAFLKRILNLITYEIPISIHY